MFDTEESQKKLCHFLRNLCFVCTIMAAGFFLFGVWGANIGSVLFNRVMVTYGTVIVVSLVIQKIFTESGHKPK